ncbi:MAG: tRNA (N(6)-L-threonylcarbamoyladenosine(37)-C(2))-methylthiotransferase MtaB, partial [Thermodesulfobacteriota bacterium]|nr:tRNA (N(6)-L-threonylcarbamoyladenosine(37)-C(2))-methylthiotransferase MtaB [Thermodesulfobacteriota bacterium]
MAGLLETDIQYRETSIQRIKKLMKKFHIMTLGCKVNQCESEALDRQLTERGGRPAGLDEAVDLCVINTCTVTARAAMQSRQAVRRAIRRNPDARIVVTGCYAQTEPEAIRRIGGVDHVVGYRVKEFIPEILRSSPEVRFDRDLSGDRFAPLSVGVADDRTRPFLKIQDGCDAFCTYCIVPRARGRSRSMPLETALANLGKLKDAGYHETVLTGIHLGAYGQDLSPPEVLSGLLDRIQVRSSPDRIRLSSIEPRELTDSVIHRLAVNDIFCPHFHIPLQSGDDDTLRRMRRPYTSAFFRDLVLKIIDRIPDAAIGVDTLIGFPGETEQAFENTRALIDALPVAYLHVFPFSARPGTLAAEYQDQLSPDTIKNRCRRMRELGMEKRARFYRRHVGRAVDILVENKRDRTTGRLKGMTSNYINVLVDGGDDLKNRLIRVRINRVDEENRVMGSVI